MKEIRCSAGEGKYIVHMIGIATDGNGLSIYMGGGERPHVGGCVLAVPDTTESSIVTTSTNATTLKATTLSTDSDVNISELGIPGHRDTDIAKEIAKYIASRTGETVSITAGIHVDAASREEIELLCTNCREAAANFVEQYHTC